MKKFNLNRFWQVFKRLMLVRSSTTLYTFLGLAAATFFILLGFTSPFTMKPMTNGELFFGIIQAFESITMCFSIGYFFFVSNIMSDLQRRQDRIGEIMLPATNLEKFVARILYVSIGYLVLCIAALVVGDVLQQIVSMVIYQGGRASLTGVILRNISHMEPSISWLFSLETMLVFNAFIVLGGVFFRKYAWIKSLIAGSVISSLLTGLLVAVAYYIDSQTDYEIYMPTGLGADIAGHVTLWAIAGLMYWLAYKIYARLQVINNRWFNV